MSVPLRRGTAFIYDSSGIGKHLFVIISDPQLDPECVVAVGFTSWTASKDQTCILEAGDHEFVKHKSCVEYHGARLFHQPWFDSILKGSKILKEVTDPLLSRIVEGALTSDETPLDIQNFLRDQLGC